MKNSSALIYLLSCASLSILMQFLKFNQLQRLREVYKKKFNYRFFSFYNASEIYGTSSDERRRFMEKANRLTMLFWSFIGLAVAFFAIKKGLKL